MDHTIHTATSCRTNLLISSRRIAGINIRARLREAIAIEPHFMFGDSDVRSALLASGVYAAWAGYPKLNIIWNVLKILAFTKEQSCSKQIYPPEIERFGLGNSL